MASSSRDVWTCKRLFCPFARRDGAHRNHGFCCNACRRGEKWHTSNCGGQYQETVAAQREPRADAHQEPEGEPAAHAPATQPKARPWRNALPPYKQNFLNGTLPGCPVGGAPPRGLPSDGKEFYNAPPGTRFRLPDDRKVRLEDFWDCVEDYTDIINTRLDTTVNQAWRHLHQAASLTNPSRQLTIFVLAKGSTYLGQSSSFIDVHDLGVDATPRLDPAGAPLYEMKEVTGIDLKVQAVVATQRVAVDAIVRARDMIEEGDLRHFAFVCSFATHRSVACAMILASFIYHEASIVFCTRRTESSARNRGMISIS